MEDVVLLWLIFYLVVFYLICWSPCARQSSFCFSICCLPVVFCSFCADLSMVYIPMVSLVCLQIPGNLRVVCGFTDCASTADGLYSRLLSTCWYLVDLVCFSIWWLAVDLLIFSDDFVIVRQSADRVWPLSVGFTLIDSILFYIYWQINLIAMSLELRIVRRSEAGLSACVFSMCWSPVNLLCVCRYSDCQFSDCASIYRLPMVIHVTQMTMPIQTAWLSVNIAAIELKLCRYVV